MPRIRDVRLSTQLTDRMSTDRMSTDRMSTDRMSPDRICLQIYLDQIISTKSIYMAELTQTHYTLIQINPIFHLCL